MDNDLSYAPCCRLKKGKNYGGPTAKSENFNQAFTHENFARIRNNLEAGVFPPECILCKEETAAGVRDMRDDLRLILGDEFKEGKLQALEIFVGSFCNMKCRMCEPLASSQWAQELGYPVHEPISADEILKDMDLKEVRFVKFLGGETVLNKNFFEILEHLKVRGQPERIQIFITSNGSVPPSQKILSALSGFQSVNILFSVDGIGRVGEYIRHGIPWTRIESSIEKWLASKALIKSCRIGIHTTLQAANYSSLADILLFCADRKIDYWSHQLLYFPIELRVENLSQAARQHMAKQLMTHPRSNEIQKYFKEHVRSGVWNSLTVEVPKRPQGSFQSLQHFLEETDRKWGVRWQEALSLTE